MSDPPTDIRSPPEDDAGRDPVEGADAICLLPAHDRATGEVVRDGMGVGRGEVYDERFSGKYGTAEESPDEPESTAADGDRPPGADGDQPDR
jgi:hypothetical protein